MHVQFLCCILSLVVFILHIFALYVPGSILGPEDTLVSDNKTVRFYDPDFTIALLALTQIEADTFAHF